MSFMRRLLCLNIMGNMGKNITLFMLILVLSILSTTAISTYRATVQLEADLRRQLPPIATLERDWDAFARENELTFDDTNPLGSHSVTMIEDISKLSYVLDYDIIGQSTLGSRELEWVVPFIDTDMLPESFMDEGFLMRYSGRLEIEGYITDFPIRGINNPEPTDLKLNLISLTSGRFMTTYELEAGAHLAVVSSLFAETNSLSVGSTFTLESNVYDSLKLFEEAPLIGGLFRGDLNRHLDEMKIMQQLIELEIVGIFDIEQDFLHVEDLARTESMIWDEVPLYNTIYLPFVLLDRIERYALPYRAAYFETLSIEEREIFRDHQSQEHPTHIHGVFLLSDARDFPNFARATYGILPDHWHVIDLSHGSFGLIMNSMATVLDIAETLFWGAFGATIIILNLLMSLFLRDRRQEIGIYMALGKEKRKILTLILAEVLIVSFFSTVLALFIGHHISEQISSQMLQRELVRQEEENPYAHLFENVPYQLRFFNPGRMSSEDMMAAYDVSLGADLIIIFFVSQALTITLSTIIPSIYIMRLHPKEILTFSAGS